MWDALASNPSIGVWVVDADDRVQFCNDRQAELTTGHTAAAMLGHLLADYFSAAWVGEQARLRQRMHETGKPGLLRQIRRGRQLESTMWALPTELPEQRPWTMTLTTVGETPRAGEADRFCVEESGLVDLGPLDVLTRRELEILALVKHGLTVEQIAKAVYRSPKTVENHVQHVRTKLHAASRAELIRIAERAGLEVRDASLPRERGLPPFPGRDGPAR